MVRIKKAELIDKETGLIRIVIEESGEEFSFVGDAWELANKTEMERILKHWRDVVIPKRRAFAKLTEAEQKAKVKELEGIEV